jgi:hypothetical protein
LLLLSIHQFDTEFRCVLAEGARHNNLNLHSRREIPDCAIQQNECALSASLHPRIASSGVLFCPVITTIVLAA